MKKQLFVLASLIVAASMILMGCAAPTAAPAAPAPTTAPVIIRETAAPAQVLVRDRQRELAIGMACQHQPHDIVLHVLGQDHV